MGEVGGWDPDPAMENEGEAGNRTHCQETDEGSEEEGATAGVGPPDLGRGADSGDATEEEEPGEAEAQEASVDVAVEGLLGERAEDGDGLSEGLDRMPEPRCKEGCTEENGYEVNDQETLDRHRRAAV